MAITKSQKNTLRQLKKLAQAGTASEAQLAKIAALEAERAAGDSKQPAPRRAGRARQPQRRGMGVYTSNTALTNELNKLTLRSNGPRLSEAEYKSILTNPGSHARTAAGAAAFVTATHPWSPASGWVGWPDGSTGRVTTPSYKTNIDISYDATLFVTPPTAPGLADCLILVPPAPEVALMYSFFDHSTSAWSMVRVIREETFTAQISGQNSNFPVMLADVGGSKHRISSKGITLHFDAPSLANQGSIYAGQLLPEYDAQNFQITGPGTPTIPTASGVGQVFTLPIDTQSLARVDPNMYEGLARRGCSMALKMAMQGKSFPFVDAVDGNFESIAQSSGGPAFIRTSSWKINLTADNSTDASQTFVFEPASRIAQPSSGAISPYDNLSEWTPGGSYTSNTYWGVIWVKGYQYASTSNAAATLRIQEICNPEIFVYGPTPISPYAHPPPIMDNLAADSALMMQQIMPSAYTEAANGFLDFLKSTVGWAAGKGRGMIQSLLGMIPAVGPLVSELSGPVLDTANGLLNATSP